MADRLRRLAVRRRRLVPLLLVLPALAAVATDVARRGERIIEFDWLHRVAYLAAALESALVWAVLLYAASRRTGMLRWISAVLFVVFGTFAFGGQQYFYDQYHAYLNVDVSIFASNFMDSIVNQLAADGANYLRAKVPPFLLSIALLFAARRWIRPRRRQARFFSVGAPVVLVSAFFIPTQHRHRQAATPDVLYLHAVGGLIRTQVGLTEQSNQLRPRARESLPIPSLVTKGNSDRNILFLILESVRADSACSSYDASCNKTGTSSRLLPNRFGFEQMRALDSSTAISLAVLWAGVGPHESRDVLHTWPLIFDYSRAIGWDTAFWTSQNMMFGNSRLWVKNLGASRFCSATDLDPASDLDIGAPEHLLAERVNAEIDELREPFLAVVQFSNVHYPYLVDPDGPQPFQPAVMSKAPDENVAFRNHYQNAIYQQDRHVASIIQRLRATPRGERTIIVYTSDHGEAFREHHQMGHTFSVFDEEVKVPAFIDAPPGLLTPEQEQNLRAKRQAFTFHVDIAPTIIDLMGIWDDPALDRFQTKMLGNSLLRPELTEQALPMTNCAGVWSCAFENWGYMRRNMKLEARAWDSGWKCYDLASDPFEKHDLGIAACGELHAHALRTFGRLPGEGKER
jgi:glucan phosphoethanolaminetransferase (alkaline phosphatase superfamily)